MAHDYDGRHKFERLTRREERAGLLDMASIGLRDGWNGRLAESGIGSPATACYAFVDKSGQPAARSSLGFVFSNTLSINDVDGGDVA